MSKTDEGSRGIEIHVKNLGKMYLIILDDVRSKEALEEIFPALPTDGRRIIITTRRREVIDFPNLKFSIHEPRRLTEEESWDLFRKIAFIHEENNYYMDIGVLETLGKEMLKKCEGLPLAVIALADILRKKKTIENWEKVKRAVSSWIMAEEGGVHLSGPVNKMLTLSYNDLHDHLKPCFLYLAMFREDAEIRTGQLIRMWIAEGFITSKMCKEGETLENVARAYLEELIDRCVVQIASNKYEGNVKSIRVHDLVRDLCINKAKQQVFLQMSTSQSSHSDSRESELRRTAIYCFNQSNYLPLPARSPNLRSLIYESDSTVFFGGQKLCLKNIHQNFKLLRVLHLTMIRTLFKGTLPTEIGSLIHLRYLGLRDMSIYELPASIENLRNLLTLECTKSGQADELIYMINIPNVLWKIEGLRHLSLQCYSSFEGRMKLDTLKQLQTLKGIGGGSWILEQLPLLSTTVQKLQIEGITSNEQLEATLRCPSIVSDNLHSLWLSWEYDVDVVLENLQPISHCQHLSKLYLRGRMGDRLSICNQFPSSIFKLHLNSTYLEEAELAALGKCLPNLMYLKLYENAYVGVKWSMMEDHFQKLKELDLHRLDEWEEWSIERGAVPQLTNLTISSCRKLMRVP